MSALWWALFAYAALAGVYWLYTLLAAFACMRCVRPLPAPAQGPQAWPPVSVVVAACNEAHTLAPAAATLLAQDYPNLQIILVDDRSTDATGAIIDELAARDPRVTPLHVTDLPPGWLGKVHALHQGAARASGEFILFTDADVHLAPAALGKAVGLCLSDKLDHLALLPVLPPVGLAVESLVAVFVRHFLVFLVRPWALGRPRSRAFVGIGAFNLVRREAFAATRGFRWLRLEVADDMGLGLLMKRSGARSRLAAGFDDVSVRWYTDLAGAVRGSEKGASTLSHFSLLRTLIATAFLLLPELAPLLLPLGFLLPDTHAIGWAGLGVLAMFLAGALPLARWGRGRLVPALLGPLVAPFMAACMIRAVLLARRRGGVLWRGTLYRKEDLLAHMRVKL